MVEQQELRNLNDPVSLREYAESIWKLRSYVFEVPMADFRSENLDTALGQIWHLLNPALQTMVYYIFFGLLLGSNRGVENFLLFLSIGVFVFGFTQRNVVTAANSIRSNNVLIKTIYFPRIVLPLSTTVMQLLAQLPALIVMILVALVSGESLSLRWLFLFVAVAFHVVFNFGISLVAARATFVWADLRNLLPVVFRLLFYMSGVLYAVENYLDPGWRLTIFRWNPIYAIITLHRYALMGEAELGNALVVAAGWSAAVFVIGFAFFRSGEGSYGSG